MIKYYAIINNDFISVQNPEKSISDLVWIDIDHPTREEELFVESLLNIDIPTREEMHEIEVSSRLYSKSDAQYITSNFVAQTSQEEYETHSLTFILKDNILITLRYFEIPSFLKFITRQKRRNAETFACGFGVFFGLIEIIIDHISDNLEMIGVELDNISKIVFKKKYAHNTTHDLQVLLKKIGHYGDLNGKLRESMLSLTRGLNFIILGGSECKKMHQESLETCSKDLLSLTEYEGYMTSRVNLLLSATMGMINIEQNAIIKIFSVAAVVFLPPTLVASIYGMNFAYMPELGWSLGYPWALFLMVISAIIPYVFFKRKRWL